MALAIHPPLDTFPKLLLRHASTRPRGLAYLHKTRGIWKEWTWSEVRRQAGFLALALSRLGLERGSAVAIIGESRPRLYWSFLATQIVGGVPVPLWDDTKSDDLAAALVRVGARMAIVQDQRLVDRIEEHRPELSLLDFVVYDDGRGLADYPDARLRSIDRLLQDGETAFQVTGGEAWLEETVGAGCGTDVAAIVHSSGATGEPRPVAVSFDRCIAAASLCAAAARTSESDRAMAHLPLAWVPGFYLNFSHALFSGFALACPESRETVSQDMREIGPTFYVAPPSEFVAKRKALHLRTQGAARTTRWLIGALLRAAQRSGTAAAAGREAGAGARVLRSLGEVFVYRPLRASLGLSLAGKVYAAGDALDAGTASFYRAIGVDLEQVYGQVESFFPLAVGCPERFGESSSFVALPGIDMRISAAGELQYRAPGLAHVAGRTDDGYLCSGDLGRPGDGGTFLLLDRMHDVGQLCDGSLVLPSRIESTLRSLPAIRNAVAMGEGRPFAACIVEIDFATVGDWAARQRLGCTSAADIARHPDVHRFVAEQMATANRSLNPLPGLATAQIRRALILCGEIDLGHEDSASRKIHRPALMRRLAVRIDALYAPGGSSSDDGTIVEVQGAESVDCIERAPAFTRKELAA